jgi:amidase
MQTRPDDTSLDITDPAAYLAKDGLELASAVRQGRVTAGALLDIAVERAEKLNPALGALCNLNEAEGRAALAQLRLDGPFVGVPFLMKDLGSPAAGFPTVAGARYFARHARAAATDGDLTARMRQAGLVIFGKTTVPEMGLNLTTEPAIGPRVCNPWDGRFSAGGSSGGAAAAVAAGIVPLAHATDAGGSIRVPAAACGVLGLKPSRGLIPQGPDFGNLLLGLASELVLSRSVRDSAAMLDACAGAPLGPYAPPMLAGPALATLDRTLPRLRIAMIDEGPLDAPVTAERSQAVAEAARLLESAGHHLEPIDAATLDFERGASARFFARTISASLAVLVADLDPAPASDDFEPITRAAIASGQRLSAATLTTAAREAALVSHSLAQRFLSIDAILTPMLADAPPLLGSFATDGDDIDGHFVRMGALAPYALLANAAGVPAISVPRGLDSSGLPLAVQFIAPLGGDVLLLQIARFFERAAPWSFPFSRGVSSAMRTEPDPRHLGPR